MEFWDRYYKWEEQAMEEAKRIYGEKAKLEVCENGQVHIFGTPTISPPNTVTPYDKFIELKR